MGLHNEGNSDHENDPSPKDAKTNKQHDKVATERESESAFPRSVRVFPGLLMESLTVFNQGVNRVFPSNKSPLQSCFCFLSGDPVVGVVTITPGPELQ